MRPRAVTLVVAAVVVAVLVGLVLWWAFAPSRAPTHRREAVTRLEWTGKTFRQHNCQGAVRKVTAKNPVITGGMFIGDTPKSWTWGKCKDHNGAGIQAGSGAGDDFVDIGTVMRNIGADGYRLVDETFDDVTIQDNDADNIRDDWISYSPKPGANVVLRNNRVDGYTLYSVRNPGGGGEDNPHTLTIDGLLYRVRPYSTSAEKRRIAGSMFKLADFRGDPEHRWTIRDVMVYVGPDRLTSGGTEFTFNPPHRSTLWENAIFCWNNASPFPQWNNGADAPPGVEILYGPACKATFDAVWNGWRPTRTATVSSLSIGVCETRRTESISDLRECLRNGR